MLLTSGSSIVDTRISLLCPSVSAPFQCPRAGPGSQGVTIRASTRVEVVWQGGDWRVVAPPGGDWGNAAARLSSLGGYTIFPGQGG